MVKKEDYFFSGTHKGFMILSMTVSYFLPNHKTDTYSSHFKMLVDNHWHKCAAKFKNHWSKSFVVLKFLPLSYSFDFRGNHMIHFWSMSYEVNSSTK